MGIRCTQLMGLPKEAEVFLAHYGKKTQAACPHCGGAIGPARSEATIYADAKRQGMFDDGPLLHDYALTDGGKAREIVQAVVRSSGPCIFLALDIFNPAGKCIREIRWPQDAIDKA